MSIEREQDARFEIIGGYAGLGVPSAAGRERVGPIRRVDSRGYYRAILVYPQATAAQAATQFQGVQVFEELGKRAALETYLLLDPTAAGSIEFRIETVEGETDEIPLYPGIREEIVIPVRRVRFRSALVAAVRVTIQAF